MTQRERELWDELCRARHVARTLRHDILSYLSDILSDLEDPKDEQQLIDRIVSLEDQHPWLFSAQDPTLTT